MNGGILNCRRVDIFFINIGIGFIGEHIELRKFFLYGKGKTCLMGADFNNTLYRQQVLDIYKEICYSLRGPLSALHGRQVKKHCLLLHLQ